MLMRMRKISFIVTIMIIVIVFIALIISGNSIEIDYSQLQLTSSVENNIYSIPENRNVCLPHILAILLFYQGYR